MLLYDYECPECGAVNEHLVKNNTVHTVECRECGGEARRKICAPQFKLPGDDPAFPTAYDAWGKKHEERARVAAKREDN